MATLYQQNLFAVQRREDARYEVGGDRYGWTREQRAMAQINDMAYQQLPLTYWCAGVDARTGYENVAVYARTEAEVVQAVLDADLILAGSIYRIEEYGVQFCDRVLG